MKIALLFWGFLTASLVLGDKTTSLISNALDVRLDQQSIVKEIGNKGVVTPNMHKPYSFEDCIGDLELVFLSLVNDVNHSENDYQLTNQRVKEKQSLKHVMSDGNNGLTYSLTSFTTQVLKVCSPESISELLPQLLLELKNPKYPQTCTIESVNYDRKTTNSCFNVLQSLLPIITIKKHDNTFKNIKKAKLTGDFIEDYKKQQFMVKNSSSTKSKNGKFKIGKFKKQTPLPTTVSKTQYKAVKTPFKHLTTKQPSQVTKPATELYKKADTVLKLKGVVKTTTVTDLLIDLSVSTILLEPKTVTITYNGSLSKSAETIRAEVTPQVFNFLSRLSAIPLTVNSNTTTTNPRPIRSRLCDRITMFGLQCPFRTTTTILTVDKTTEYVNININVNENKGNIKLLRQSVSQQPNTVTKVITEKTTIRTTIASTKYKQVKTLTTITNTLLTTKTKYKILTQTQTKSTQDCDNGTNENDVDDNGLTEDDYFEDDSTDYFRESNEFVESSEDSETNGNSEGSDSNEILIIQLAVNNTNYSTPTYPMKANDSKIIESSNSNNNSFVHFADKLEFDNGAKLKPDRYSYLELLGCIALFWVFLIL